MSEKTRKIIQLQLLKQGEVHQETVFEAGIRFEITTHAIGWDFDFAEDLIKRYDGYADGFVLNGIQKKAEAGRAQILHPAYLKLMQAAIKTPLYLADDVRELFMGWGLQRFLKEQSQIFQGRKILFHCAILSPVLNAFTKFQCDIAAADPLITTGVPILLRGMTSIRRFLHTLKPVIRFMGMQVVSPNKYLTSTHSSKHLASWIKDCEVFVTFGSLLDPMSDLSCLKGKIVFVDYLSPKTRIRLEAEKPLLIIESIPQAASSLKNFALMSCLLDQVRLAHDSPLSFEEYLLKWIQEQSAKPIVGPAPKQLPRRCAFVIHPLSQQDLFRHPLGKFLKSAPPLIRNTVESLGARMPIFYYGQLARTVSQATGQEVICDIYAIGATPKQMYELGEEYIYDRMVEAAEMAQKRGAEIMGLGAYTKVIGDAGVTIARRSPIPVTNGNSYSASTTLWAARKMIEEMALVQPSPDGTRYRAKAMVIGATGSIGRVSSLLLATAVEELVLVAPRPDKLLEVQEEVLSLFPQVKVKVTTHSGNDLPLMDLIVTATSNISGRVLDIEKVKPGAVICDCSRPLDIGAEEAKKRPDVMVIESGEVLLPGEVHLNCDIGLPKPSVFACMAETILLAMDGRIESFSLSKQLSLERVKQIYQIGLKHGSRLSEISGPFGVITDEQIGECRKAALHK